MSTQTLEGISSPTWAASSRPSATSESQDAVIQAWTLHNRKNYAEAWNLLRPLVARSVANPDVGVIYARLAPHIDHEAPALSYLEWLLTLESMPPDRAAALHSLAFTILDRRGDYDAAFQHARLCKQVYRLPFDARSYTAFIDAQIAYFTADKLARLPRPGHGSRRPVFIIGMPRSGTSLVEQILACHPQVFAAGELATLPKVRSAIPEKAAPEERFPMCLDSMGIRHTDQLAGAYLKAIAALNSTARYVTDKLPTNFVLLGLIGVLFRECHVIHCVRHPLDTCVSCYTTGFEPPLPFTHDLTDLGGFYRDYRRLMTHFQSAVGMNMIEVRYEAMVENLESETRQLLERLDLPWDGRCLEFHNNLREVGSASVDQVRRPLYKTSIGKWRHYEKHLGALRTALGPDGVA